MDEESIKQMLNLLPQSELVAFLVPLMKGNKALLDKLQSSVQRVPSLPLLLPRRKVEVVASRSRGKEKERELTEKEKRREREREERRKREAEFVVTDPILWFPECPEKIKTLILSYVDPVESEGSIFLVCKEWNDLWKQSEIWEMAYLNRWLRSPPTSATSIFATLFFKDTVKPEQQGHQTATALPEEEEKGTRGDGEQKYQVECDRKKEVDFKKLYVERYEVEKRWQVEESKQLSLAQILPSASTPNRVIANTSEHSGWVERLWHAVSNDNAILVEALIEEAKPQVSPSTFIGRTHIRRAIQNKNQQLVAVLLQESKQNDFSAAASPIPAGRGRKRKQAVEAANGANLSKGKLREDNVTNIWNGYTSPLEHAVIGGSPEMVATVLRTSVGSCNRAAFLGMDGGTEKPIEETRAFKLAASRHDQVILNLLKADITQIVADEANKLALGDEGGFVKKGSKRKTSKAAPLKKRKKEMGIPSTPQSQIEIVSIAKQAEVVAMDAKKEEEPEGGMVSPPDPLLEPFLEAAPDSKMEWVIENPEESRGKRKTPTKTAEGTPKRSRRTKAATKQSGEDQPSEPTIHVSAGSQNQAEESVGEKAASQPSVPIPPLKKRKLPTPAKAPAIKSPKKKGRKGRKRKTEEQQHKQQEQQPQQPQLPQQQQQQQDGGPLSPPIGWKMETINNAGGVVGKQEYHYISPDGIRCRSGLEMQKYLQGEHYGNRRKSKGKRKSGSTSTFPQPQHVEEQEAQQRHVLDESSQQQVTEPVDLVPPPYYAGSSATDLAMVSQPATPQQATIVIDLDLSPDRIVPDSPPQAVPILPSLSSAIMEDIVALPLPETPTGLPLNAPTPMEIVLGGGWQDQAAPFHAPPINLEDQQQQPLSQSSDQDSVVLMAVEEVVPVVSPLSASKKVPPKKRQSLAANAHTKKEVALKSAKVKPTLTTTNTSPSKRSSPTKTQHPQQQQQQPQPQHSDEYSPLLEASGGDVGEGEEEWSCAKCTFLNAGGCRCIVCGGGKRRQATKVAEKDSANNTKGEEQQDKKKSVAPPTPTKRRTSTTNKKVTNNDNNNNGNVNGSGETVLRRRSPMKIDNLLSPASPEKPSLHPHPHTTQQQQQQQQGEEGTTSGGWVSLVDAGYGV